MEFPLFVWLLINLGISPVRVDIGVYKTQALCERAMAEQLKNPKGEYFCRPAEVRGEK